MKIVRSAPQPGKPRLTTSAMIGSIAADYPHMTLVLAATSSPPLNYPRRSGLPETGKNAIRQLVVSQPQTSCAFSTCLEVEYEGHRPNWQIARWG